MPVPAKPAFEKAVAARDLPTLAQLIHAHPTLATHPQAALHLASQAWIEGMQLLHDHGATWNASYRNYRPLHACIQEGPHKLAPGPDQQRLAAVQWLLAHGADPELKAAWPAARALLIAAFWGVQEYVDTLLAHGVPTDGFSHCALGNRQALRQLLRRDPAFPSSRDDGGVTPLQCVCASRIPSESVLLSLATLLLDAGADPDALTPSWSHDINAISFTVSAHHPSLFELLLQRGVAPNHGLLPAIWSPDLSYAATALRFGADVNATRDGDKPILNQMIRWGQLKQALWLLQHHASPNLADDRGWTAAHQAASRGNETLWRAVIDHGADLDLKNHDGDTPVDIARDNKRAKLLRLLAL